MENNDQHVAGEHSGASLCSAWVSCGVRPPVGESFGCFFHSIDVLFTNGKDQWVGYLQTWEDEEYEPQWKMKGPDGWGVASVTHWMPLPTLPNAFDGEPNKEITHP